MLPEKVLGRFRYWTELFRGRSAREGRIITYTVIILLFREGQGYTRFRIGRLNNVYAAGSEMDYFNRIIPFCKAELKRTVYGEYNIYASYFFGEHGEFKIELLPGKCAVATIIYL